MKIWWCQEHENIGSEKRCQHGLTDRFYNLTNPAPCRMVPMRLIPDNAETVERLQMVIAAWAPDFNRHANHEFALELIANLDGETP